jgi:hypothetical protein
MLVELHSLCSAERKGIANYELEVPILKHLRLFEITGTDEDHETLRNSSQCTCRYASRIIPHYKFQFKEGFFIQTKAHCVF